MIAEELAFALSTQTTPVRVKNLPPVQKVEGEVTARLRGMPDLMEMLASVREAIYETEAPEKEVQKVEVTNPAAFPAIPEIPFPEDVAKAIKKLPALKADLESIETAIKAIDVAPTVEVKAPVVNVDAPDLSAIERRLESLEEAVRDIPAPKPTKLGPVEELLKGIKYSLDTLVFPSPQRLPLDSMGRVLVSSSASEDSLYLKSFDRDITTIYAIFDTPDDPTGQATKRLVDYMQFTDTDGTVYRKTFEYDTYGNPSAVPKWTPYTDPNTPASGTPFGFFPLTYP